jgi:hypothetical protein
MTSTSNGACKKTGGGISRHEVLLRDTGLRLAFWGQSSYGEETNKGTLVFRQSNSDTVNVFDKDMFPLILVYTDKYFV